MVFFFFFRERSFFAILALVSGSTSVPVVGEEAEDWGTVKPEAVGLVAGEEALEILLQSIIREFSEILIRMIWKLTDRK